MSMRKLAILLCILTAVAVSAWPAMASGQMAILGLQNFSGVTRSGGIDLEARAPQQILNALGKQGENAIWPVDETEKRLEKAGLAGLKAVINLCTDEDLMRAGAKIGAAKVGFIHILGYNEIKRENQKKVFQVQLGLTMIDCADGSRSEWIGEGLNELMSKAIENAASNLAAQYAGAPAEANAGETRDENEPIVGNLVSRKYHLKDCRHLPAAENCVNLDNKKLAEEEGFSACLICYPPFMSGTRRDSSLESDLGREACGTIEYYYRVENHPEITARLEQVCESLVKNTKRHHIKYRFRYLDDDEINAFGTSTGYIYVTRGLMEIIESDDELALVLAHEIGHIERRHAVIRYKTAVAAAIVGAILTGNSDMGYLMSALVLMGFSREQEKEADEVAVSRLKQVGRDYKVYKGFFAKLMDLKEGRTVFSYHPEPEDRIENLDEQLKLYEAFVSNLN